MIETRDTSIAVWLWRVLRAKRARNVASFTLLPVAGCAVVVHIGGDSARVSKCGGGVENSMQQCQKYMQEASHKYFEAKSHAICAVKQNTRALLSRMYMQSCPSRVGCRENRKLKRYVHRKKGSGPTNQCQLHPANRQPGKE